MSALTLPGSIPGLLRRGSPVVSTDELGFDDPDAVVCSVESYGYIVGSDAGRWPSSPKGAALDLTDATGRAHAAWWLAAQHGEPSPTTEVWDFCPETTSRDVRDAEGNHLDLIDGGPALWMCGANGWTTGDAPLADLDPNDPRLLPDGSRWVDAEALRRVVLHVAGVAS